MPIAAEPWDPQKHPRGQPGNPGQFASTGGTTGSTTASHHWEPEDSFHPDNFERTVWQGEPAEKTAERRSWWHSRWALRQKFRDTLADSDVPDEKRAEHLRTAQAVLDNMPAAALKMAVENVQAVKWYDNSRAITDAMVGQGSPHLVGGCWESFGGSNGNLHLNGGPKSIYAHELGHAVDWIPAVETKTEHGTFHSGGRRISSSQEWREAFDRELAGGQLSSYGATSRSEGFAEFCRFMWSGLRPSAVQEEFPLCYSVMLKYGLAHPVRRS